MAIWQPGKRVLGRPGNMGASKFQACGTRSFLERRTRSCLHKPRGLWPHMPSVNTCPAAVILESESGGDLPPEFALLLACSTLRTDGTRQAEISRLSESGLDWPRVL